MDRLILKNIDDDLAERILASGLVKRTKPVKTKKKPRAGATYRSARRNATRETGAIMVRRGPKVRPHSSAPYRISLNRSDRWPRAKSYHHAREIGPSAEVVR